jgi:CubicO group peptidase (beta-lactamase class C family)
VAVTQLAAQGKVDFYAPLGSYLDGFTSDAADHVTVHNLLTYTSGYPANLTSPPGTSGNGTTRTEAFNAMLAALRQEKPATTPGTQFGDSSINYFLAGAIVWAVSAQYPWEYLPQHVLAPAGMARTAFYTGEQWLDDPRFAHLYGPQVNGQRQDVTSEFTGQVNGFSGGSGLFSTVPDLLRFANALSDGTLLDPEWAELRSEGRYPTSAQYGSNPRVGSVLVGYGSEERVTVGGQHAYGHQTQLRTRSNPPGGAMAMVMLYPGLGVTAIALSNYDVDGGGFVAQTDRIITGSAS